MKSMITRAGIVSLMSALVPTASAFFGFGGCPTNLPINSYAPYGPVPQVPNGVYYTHYFDYAYADMQAAKVTYQPTGDRQYLECMQTQITSNNYGATYARGAHYKGTVYDQKTYTLYCQGSLCLDQAQMYALMTVYYDNTHNVLINQFCFDFSRIIQALIPALNAALPVNIPPFIITFVANQFNVVHMSWMEVMSSSRTLSTAAVNSIATYVNAFPISNIGNSGTFLDFLAPYLEGKDGTGLLYNMSYLETINQDASVCY